MKRIVAVPTIMGATTQPNCSSGSSRSGRAAFAVQIPALDLILNHPAVLAGLTKNVLVARTADAGAVHAALRAAVAMASVPVVADDLQLLDANDVAKMMGLTKGVVYEMARRGKIGSVDVGCVGSRAVRFTRQQVADFVKSREKSAVDSSAR
ncbi:MAG: helix-turn-helix domain-containing protein [Candidatus Binatus sp.]|jgi:excisionase family DNA binding protein